MSKEKIYVGITDERWLYYHYQHNSKSANFWSIHHGSVNVYKEFNKHLEEIGGKENLKQHPFYFVFKTKVDYKFIDKSLKLKLDGNSLYGWAKIVDVDEPTEWNKNHPKNPLPTYDIYSLWNKYGTLNGADQVAILHQYLNKVKDWQYLSNIVLDDIHFFDPVEVDWWLQKYPRIQKGKVLYFNRQKPLYQGVVDKDTTDDNIASILYWQLKDADPSF